MSVNHSIQTEEINTLGAYVEYLRRDYYDVISGFLEQIDVEEISMQLDDDHRTIVVVFVDAVRKYVNHRVNIWLPYIQELAEKQDGGHNCATCSGKCNVQHTAALLDFNISLLSVKDTLYMLKSVLSLASKYASIHSLIALADVVGQALHLEEEVLQPMVKTAQTHINAVN